MGRVFLGLKKINLWFGNFGVGEMFGGDFADKCAPLMPNLIGGGAEGLACKDPGARTPISVSGNLIYLYYRSLTPPCVYINEFCNQYLVPNLQVFSEETLQAQLKTSTELCNTTKVEHCIGQGIIQSVLIASLCLKNIEFGLMVMQELHLCFADWLPGKQKGHY